jgi:addiction module RelE/StbE family toxin
MPVRFSRRALRDLQRIRDFVAKDKPIAASRLAVELVAACDRLEVFPERGRPGSKRGTRELTTVWPYVIIYKTTDQIEIVAIRHGRRRPVS